MHTNLWDDPSATCRSNRQRFAHPRTSVRCPCSQTARTPLTTRVAPHTHRSDVQRRTPTEYTHTGVYVHVCCVCVCVCACGARSGVARPHLHTSPMPKMMKDKTMSCQPECNSMLRTMTCDSTAWSRGYGLRLRRSPVGSSVAKASDANESMIRFTHNICKAVGAPGRGDCGSGCRRGHVWVVSCMRQHTCVHGRCHVSVHMVGVMCWCTSVHACFTTRHARTGMQAWHRDSHGPEWR